MNLSQIMIMTMIIHTGSAICFAGCGDLKKGEYLFNYISDGDRYFYEVTPAADPASEPIEVDRRTFVYCFAITSLNIINQ